MKQSVLADNHSLRIIPTSLVLQYTRIGSQVIMRTGYPSGSTSALNVPGTVRVEHSESANSKIIDKKLVYTRADVSEEAARKLEALKITPLIALYNDSAGNPRVCGSPTCPLRLRYEESGGSYTVTLTGTDTLTDGFIA